MAERPVAPVRSMDDGFWLERDHHDDSAAASDDAIVSAFLVCDGDLQAIRDLLMGYQDQHGQDQHALLLHDDHHDDSAAAAADAVVSTYVVSDDDVQAIHDLLMGYQDQLGEDQQALLLHGDHGHGDDAQMMLHPTRHIPRFLGGSAPHFVAAGMTAGFMRVAAADAPHQEQEGGGERHILVHYRYTRFSAASSSDGSMEARGSTREHQLRFITAAGHGARSLDWAGASLAHLIYPDGCSKRLRELWTSLASQVSLPPGAVRIEVFVDVGILRRANSTDSMDHMRAALEDMMEKPWPTRFTGMELNLPEPVRCGHDDNDTDGGQRPAKRRRVVATEDEESCSVCYELLKGDDLAAWPGCGKPHVLHGACMQAVLESNPLCPMCRRDLYIKPKF
ncbi:uncharacterized protein LOC124665820 [Lolium rigidum]|uniref:uncharacterized protein LOC124665820 n=1 Tax=Lolium rigidum TaxID=89674 RepID=UPI001F5C9A56|nr:uncharacterized protein LOC124665820 [Lolium rigidum]